MRTIKFTEKTYIVEIGEYSRHTFMSSCWDSDPFNIFKRRLSIAGDMSMARSIVEDWCKYYTTRNNNNKGDSEEETKFKVYSIFCIDDIMKL